MNKLTIIGNLTKDPVYAVTQGNNIPQCRFTVAVNRARRSDQGQQQEADFFNVTVWRNQADPCAKYLRKGSKVCIIGPVTARVYQAQDGSSRVSMDVNAEYVEFLSSRNDNQAGTAAASSIIGDANDTAFVASPAAAAPSHAQQQSFSAVETDELPF